MRADYPDSQPTETTCGVDQVVTAAAARFVMRVTK
jgi:hypothetical protein